MTTMKRSKRTWNGPDQVCIVCKAETEVNPQYRWLPDLSDPSFRMVICGTDCPELSEVRTMSDGEWIKAVVMHRDAAFSCV